MEEAITEAKRALVQEDRDANRDNFVGDRDSARMIHLARAQAHATLAVAIGLDRLLSHLEDRSINVRTIG